MGTKINSNYSDLLTFTRASKGHALRPVSYGDELVTNGTFDTDTTGWTANNSSLSVVSGKLRLTQQGVGLGFAQTTVTTVVGKLYRFEWDYIAGTSATPTARLGSASLAADIINVSADSNGINFVATSSTTYVNFRMAGTTDGLYATFDNVSVKEVTFDQPDGTLTLFEHPVNVPRVEWDSAGNRLGLLVEEARTNLHTYSQDFSNSYWNKTAATISTDVTTAPDGTTTADKLVVNNATADTEKFVNRNIYAYVNQTVTGSVFLKKAEYTWVQVNLYNLSSNPNRVWVNLDTGAVGTNLSSIPVTVTDVGNGWYRVALTATIQQVGNAFMTVAVADADGDLYTNIGDEESGTFLWGAQLEAGSFPTSYIKSNSGSTTTRSADVASIPVDDFGYNQSAGTLYAEFDVNTLSDQINGGVVVLIADAGDNRIRINTVSDNIRGQIRKDASNSFSVSVSGYGSSTGEKVALAFKENDAAFVISGATLDTDSSVAIPRIETLQVAGNSFCGHLKSTKYYPRRLTNAQLQDLTS